MNVNVTKMRAISSEAHPNLKASCSVLLGGVIQLENVLVKKKTNEEAYYIDLPKRKDRYGEYIDVAHPTTSEMQKKITDAVLSAYSAGDKFVPNAEEQPEKLAVSYNLTKTEHSGSTRAYGDLWLGTGNTNEFVIKDVKIREFYDTKKNTTKLFVAMPSYERQYDNGERHFFDYIHPINEQFREYLNIRGVNAYEALDADRLGNIEYKELKANSDKTISFSNQNITFGKSVGEQLDKLGCRWCGFISQRGVVITVDAENSDLYKRAEQAAKDEAKGVEKAAAQKEAPAATKEDEEEYFSMDEDEPF